ncbi:MAG: hypothetical protein ACI9MR_002127, partial [Myxococcota bacterium]
MKRFFKVLLPLLVIAMALGTVSYLMATKPEPPKSPPAPKGAIVITQPAKAVSNKPTISAVGRAQPSKVSSLQPEVAGRIIELHKDLEMGGFLKAGEVAFKIDDQDYQLVRRQTASQVSKARFELQVEAG